MILSSLRFRSRPTTAAQSSSSSVGLTVSGAEDSATLQSHQSTCTSDLSLTSVPSSPTPRPAKRLSNNLFGSGKLRDYTYLRNVAKNTNPRTHSLTPTESSQANTSMTESLRPVTPESSTFSSSTQSTPNEKVSSAQFDPSDPSSPYGEPLVSVAEYRIAKTLGPLGLKRASIALEEAIREIQEAEDEIVMPRSTPIPRTNLDHSPPSPELVVRSFLSEMLLSFNSHVLEKF